MYQFLLVFLLFLIYSFLGWLVDICGNYIDVKEFKNRGFLIGPYCPIYGVASIFMLYFLSKYQNDIIVLFVMSVLVCSVIEYFTSYIMEKLFHARWWDYSKIPFNINGRICIPYSIIFGVLSLLLVEFINPFVVNILITIPKIALITGGIILFILFAVDVIVSFSIINKLKITADNIRKDKTEEITKKVREVLSKKSILFRRLLNAFPDFEALGKKVKSIFTKG